MTFDVGKELEAKLCPTCKEHMRLESEKAYKELKLDKKKSRTRMIMFTRRVNKAFLSCCDPCKMEAVKLGQGQ